MSNDVMDYSGLSSEGFRAVWQTLLALAPGLHPDEIGQENGGWEEHPVIRSIGQEALRRYEEGDFDDDDLYDYRAQRSGFPHREEYPDYVIDEGYYRGLGGEVLRGVRGAVDGLSLGSGGVSENPVIELLDAATRGR